MQFLLNTPTILLAATNTTEIILGALIIAIGAVVGLSLLAKPNMIYGSPGSGWGDFVQGHQLLVGTLLRVAGLAIFCVGLWQGIGFFRTELATIETADIPVDTTRRADEFDIIMGHLKAAYPDQYSDVEVTGTRLFLWKTPGTGDVRIYTINTILGNATGYLEEDLDYHVENAHRLRLKEYSDEYPYFSYDEAKDYVVPNIFPPASGSALYTANQRFDPAAEATWKGLRIVYWMQSVEGKRGGTQVRRSHLRRWDKTPQDLWALSILNLNRLFNEKKGNMKVEKDGNVTLISDPASLISAYPLSKNFFPVVGKIAGGKDFYFMMPTFGTMLILPKDAAEDLPKLLGKFEEIASQPNVVILTRNVFLATPNDIEVVQGAEAASPAG